MDYRIGWHGAEGCPRPLDLCCATGLRAHESVPSANDMAPC